MMKRVAGVVLVPWFCWRAVPRSRRCPHLQRFQIRGRIQMAWKSLPGKRASVLPTMAAVGLVLATGCAHHGTGAERFTSRPPSIATDSSTTSMSHPLSTSKSSSAPSSTTVAGASSSVTSATKAHGTTPAALAGYEPPTQVQPTSVVGAWTLSPFVAGDMSGSPLALQLPDGLPHGENRNGVTAPIGGEVVSRIVLLKSLTAKGTLRIAAPFRMELEITKGNYGVPHPGPVIWRGNLPPLPTHVAINGASFTFRWHERDASGKQVPPGTYYLHLGTLPTLRYVLAGIAGTEQIPTVSGTTLPSITGHIDVEKIVVS